MDYDQTQKAKDPKCNNILLMYRYVYESQCTANDVKTIVQYLLMLPCNEQGPNWHPERKDGSWFHLLLLLNLIWFWGLCPTTGTLTVLHWNWPASGFYLIYLHIDGFKISGFNHSLAWCSLTCLLLGNLRSLWRIFENVLCLVLPLNGVYPKNISYRRIPEKIHA